MDKKNFFKYTRVVLYVILIVVFILLKYTDIINFGPCYIKENLGLLCPSCGITRATKALLNFEFTSAIEYNSYYTLLLFPTLLILFLDDIICIILKKRSLVDIIFGN